jgi:hypothetical protein
MRRDYRVVWHEVEPGEFRLLQRLAEGATLAEVLISEATNSAMDVDALASKLRQLFCRWATLRLFVDVGGVLSVDFTDAYQTTARGHPPQTA